MFCLLSTLRHFLIHFLLLWTLVSTLPTSSNLNLQQQYNNRRRLQRDASNEFPQHGSLDLVLKNDFLEFQICCTKDGGCNAGVFQFCFKSEEVRQDSSNNKCGEGTCAYKIDYKGDQKYSFMGSISTFSTTNRCLGGKITNDKVYVSYYGNEKENDGCPLAFESGNRLKLRVLSIPYGVTVTATNAQKYVEPTISTSSPQNSNVTIPQIKLEEEGMSDGVKYGLIGISVLFILLIVCGAIYGIYSWQKSKKNPKPAPAATVIKDKKPIETLETKTKPLEKKQKDVMKVKNEINKDEQRPKAPPTDVIPSAEPQPSKEPTTKPSAEPEPLQQLSKEPSVVPPSAEPSKPPPELPKATITIAELITRAERNRHRGMHKMWWFKRKTWCCNRNWWWKLIFKSFKNICQQGNCCC